MRYMVFVKMREDVGAAPESASRGDGEGDGRAVRRRIDDRRRGLAPSAQSTQIELRAGDVITTNGPWAEAKEVAGGYAIVEARSHEEAVEGARRVIEIHKEHWPGWEGSVEIREIHGAQEG